MFRCLGRTRLEDLAKADQRKEKATFLFRIHRELPNYWFCDGCEIYHHNKSKRKFLERPAIVVMCDYVLPWRIVARMVAERESLVAAGRIPPLQAFDDNPTLIWFKNILLRDVTNAAWGSAGVVIMDDRAVMWIERPVMVDNAMLQSFDCKISSIYACQHFPHSTMLYNELNRALGVIPNPWEETPLQPYQSPTYGCPL
jgi:hypothetical protein